MIISVEQAKNYVDFAGWDDERIRMKLDAIEQTIRAYTHNNFQDIAYRRTADIIDGTLHVDGVSPFVVGDTLQISESPLNAGLYVVDVADESTVIVEKNVVDEKGVLLTKIKYPADVIDCVLNLLRWEVEHREKVGIKSETLSRHSVTYFDQDANNQIMGYPAALLGVLKAYKKARF